MGLVQITAPTTYPVTLEQVKAHLRIEHSYDDDWLNDAIDEAVDYIQAMTRHQLMPATYRYTLDQFPAENTIKLPLAKAQSVSSVQYIDSAGDTQTLSSSNYTTDLDSRPARIVLKSNQSWPSTTEVPAAVTIAYVAGYANAAGVPANAKALLKALVGTRYENRELVLTGTIVNELPFTGQIILQELRSYEVV
jgi:uncharacterized phiE125 gp8 family phage protein